MSDEQQTKSVDPDAKPWRLPMSPWGRLKHAIFTWRNERRKKRLGYTNADIDNLCSKQSAMKRGEMVFLTKGERAAQKDGWSIPPERLEL